jgi:HlyD family type I secretion membrane fusion protein
MTSYGQSGVPAIHNTDAFSAQSKLTDFRGVARMGYIAIALSFGGFGVWSAVAPLDSAAVATASVAVTSDKKPISHLEGGIVKEVHVVENQRVKAGQILFKLQPVQAEANHETLRKQLNGALAQEARLLAERDLKPVIEFPASLVEQRHLTDVASTLFDQEKQFAERKRSLEGQVAVFQSRIEQINSEIAGKSARVDALRSEVSLVRTRLDRIRPVMERGFSQRNRFEEQEERLIRQEGELKQLIRDIERSQKMKKENEVQIRVTLQRQVEEASQQLGDVKGRLTEIREKIKVARDALSRVDVRAPQDGVVQNLKVHAVGHVVRPGEPVAEMVTVDDGLIMTARVQPNDIDMVQPGQKAEIRFPQFATRQSRATLGKVDTISPDATVDQQTKQTFYNVRVSIDMETLPEQLRSKLIPGMQATVLITTGERTFLRFMTGPLVDALARTMRER